MLNGHFSNNWAGCLSHDYNSVACFQVEAQLILEIRNHSLACLGEIRNCSFASDSSPCLVRNLEMTLSGICSGAHSAGCPAVRPSYDASLIVFQVQLKVQVFIFKVLHGTGPGSFQDCLSASSSTHPIRSDKMSMLQVPFPEGCHLVRPWRCTFSVAPQPFGIASHLRLEDSLLLVY